MIFDAIHHLLGLSHERVSRAAMSALERSTAAAWRAIAGPSLEVGDLVLRAFVCTVGLPHEHRPERQCVQSARCV